MPPRPTANEPRRHHYVPRAYLAPFTGNGTTRHGRVWVYGRADTPPAQAALMAVAFEDHMYTVPDERGVLSTALERRLAREIEELFTAWQCRVIKAARGTAPDVLATMSRRERVVVARYILYQHLRTPAQRLMSERQRALSHYLHAIDPAERASYQALWAHLGPAGRRRFTLMGGPLDSRPSSSFTAPA